MEIIFKLLLRKFIIAFMLFILIVVLFLFTNNFLMLKLNAAIEKRINILNFINEQTKKEVEKTKIVQKIKDIENNYKINFTQFKNEIFSIFNLSDLEVKNLILSLAKKENLNLKEKNTGDSPKTLIFSLVGNFNDLKNLENMLITNKIKAKINSVRVFKQGENYLFEIEILIL